MMALMIRKNVTVRSSRGRVEFGVGQNEDDEMKVGVEGLCFILLRGMNVDDSP